jgi:hypothetical protein
MRAILIYTAATLLARGCEAFVPFSAVRPSSCISNSPSLMKASNNDKDEATIEEEQRLKIFEARRGQIRSALKAAESLRNYRITNGMNHCCCDLVQRLIPSNIVDFSSAFSRFCSRIR